MLERDQTNLLVDKIENAVDTYFYNMNMSNLDHESELYIDLIDHTRDIAHAIVDTCNLDAYIQLSDVEKALYCPLCRQGKDCTMVTCEGYKLCRLLYMHKFKEAK